MALQGTIDAIPLTDVLQLLSSPQRSGRLLLEGERGRAELWIRDGAVVGGVAPNAPTQPAALVVELLRFGQGSFSFDDVVGRPPTEMSPVPLGDCLHAAADILEDLARIEAMVPSVRHRVRLAPEVEGPGVELDPDEWRLLAAAGDGPTVEVLGARLGMDVIAACAAVAGLSERALVVVAPPEHFPFEDLLGPARGEEPVAAPPPIQEPWQELPAGLDGWSARTVHDEVLEQTAGLSPRAAGAIAAVLGSTAPPPPPFAPHAFAIGAPCEESVAVTDRPITFPEGVS